MTSFKLECVFPSLPRTARGEFIVLGSDPKGQNILYCNGNNVYIRDIADPTKCDIYAEHTSPPTVAVYSPSRFYISSGDKTGKVRIWDTVNEEHILKNEFHVLGAAVKDIAWAPDNSKIAVGGEGREFYAKCITADSGNTVGDLSGHTKSVNSVAYKPSRPFRLVTASEDFKTQYYEGPPFKYKSQSVDHGNFVNCVRYQPSGDVYITAGQDGMAFVFDGKTGELQGPLGGGKAHNGGIYSMAFSPDGKEVLTVSGDKTAKIWNVETKQNVVTFNMGNALTDMQVGCLWQGDNIVTVSLSGFINYLDRNNPSQPKRVQKGHNKAIICAAVSPDKSRIYSGASDGQIFVWNAVEGSCNLVEGKGHSNQVSDMAIVDNKLVTVGMDDTCRYTDISKNEYDSTFCKLPSQPYKVSAFSSGAVAVSCISDIVVVNDGNITFQQRVKWEPKCVAVQPKGSMVAFGGQHDMHIFEYDGSTLTGKHSIKTQDDVTNVQYSPDGAYLAVTTGSRRFTILYNVADNYKEVYSSTKQTAKIFSLAWSPDSEHFATGSLDGSVVIWNLQSGFGNNVEVHMKEAHKKAHVSCLEWLSENILISASNDSCIKQWSITYGAKK